MFEKIPKEKIDIDMENKNIVKERKVVHKNQLVFLLKILMI